MIVLAFLVTSKLALFQIYGVCVCVCVGGGGGQEGLNFRIYFQILTGIEGSYQTSYHM